MASDLMAWLGIRKSDSSGIDGAITWRPLIAEYLGTLLLVFMGTLLAVAPANVDPIAGPFAGGLALASIIQGLGHVSGAHVNPAMSMGFVAARRMSFVKAVLYSCAQCAGAISGSAILKAITPEANQGPSAMGSTALNPEVWAGQGFAIEVVITFILVFMTISATDPKRTDVNGSLPLAIGIYVTSAGLAAGPFTGASMNPARSLGPAVISGFWANHWVYWAGPILGGLIAGLVHHTLFDARFFEDNFDLDTTAGSGDNNSAAGGNQGRANNARAYDEELRIGSGHRGSYEEKGNKY